VQPPARPEHPRSIRLATWNLWWRFGDWSDRLNRISEVLSVLDADVIGLQEIWQDATDNQAAILARELGLYWVWAPHSSSQRWRHRLGDAATGDEQIGVAVLSRWPIIMTSTNQLPIGYGPDEGRVALATRIATPVGELSFTTTQLASDPAGSATRIDQIEALARHVATYDVGREHALPPVVCGDFNASPEADEMRLIEGHLTAPVISGQLLVNAWRYHPLPIPPTWNPANPFVAMTREPAATIDHILVGRPPRHDRGWIERVGVFAEGPTGSGWASDHAGVWVDIAGGQD